ncbi:MAG TPA: AbrB/MazE/SpoVT family DNA-binding domain-containing protein [Candidatus Nanoarchaeia archaeon]|nr:AbrB/MazE/SpoVT family DNA-binding domain-containing protein [Candidatus Nanoarchaeia archaeon]
MEINAIAKRWGSSLGIIIPKEVVLQERIKEDDEIRVKIERKRPKAGVLFGYLKDWKRPTQEIKNEMREGWLSKHDREQEERWKTK